MTDMTNKSMECTKREPFVLKLELMVTDSHGILIIS